MDLRKILNPSSSVSKKRRKVSDVHNADENLDEAKAREERNLIYQKEISSETSIIEEAFEAILTTGDKLALRFKEKDPKASKLLKSHIGTFKFWLHDLNLHSGHLDRFLTESDHLRAAVYMILLRLVRLFIRASEFLLRWSIRVDSGFITLEEKLCQADPNTFPWRATKITERSDDGNESGNISLLAFRNDITDVSDGTDGSSSWDSGEQEEEEGEDTKFESSLRHLHGQPEQDTEITTTSFVDKLASICESFCILADTISESMEIALVDEAVNKKMNRVPLPDYAAIKSAPLDYIRDNLSSLFPKAEKYLLDRLAWESWHLHYSIRNGIERRQQLKEKSQRGADSTYSSLDQSIRAPSLNGGLQKTVTPAIQQGPSYAMSVATSVSSVNLGNRPKEPRPPIDLSEDIPFTCNICSQTLHSIKNRRAWRKHVLSDLRPYICTVSDCTSASNRYMDRLSWIQHESTHFQNVEKSSFSSENKQGVEKSNNTIRECPFCRAILTGSVNSRQRHVARHLEDIALPILTMHMEEDEPSEDESSSIGSSDKYESSEDRNNETIRSGILESEEIDPELPFDVSTPSPPYSVDTKFRDGEFNENGERRGSIPKHATDILHDWLRTHISRPWPTEDQKRELATQTGLTLDEMSNWFDLIEIRMRLQERERDRERVREAEMREREREREKARSRERKRE